MKEADADGAPSDAGRRAESPSGRFVVEVTKTDWGGSFLAQDYKIWGAVHGKRIDRVDMKAVDAGGAEIEQDTVDVPPRGGTVEFRVDGKRLLLADYPVTVIISAVGGDGESADVTLEIAHVGR